MLAKGDTRRDVESSNLFNNISGTNWNLALLFIEVIMLRWLFNKLTGDGAAEASASAPIESLIDKSALADFVRLLREADDDDATETVAEVESEY